MVQLRATHKKAEDLQPTVTGDGFGVGVGKL